jgi:hypothetical protein
VIEERLGLCGRGGADEARAFAFAGVGEKGELRDGEDFAAGLQGAEVHLPLVIGEDTEACHLLGEPVGLCFAVSVRNADEEQEAGAYLGDSLAAHGDGSVLYALEDYLHGCLEGLAAPVAGFYLVPVADSVLGRVPAEKDDATFPFVREVQEAPVEVLEDDAELADTLDR